MEDLIASRIQDIHRILIFGGFALFLIVEAVWPYLPFPDERSRFRHLARNMGLWLLGYLLVAVVTVVLLLPNLARTASGFWSLSGFGGPLAQGIAGLLLLDFANWLFHLLAHRVRWLWLIHSVHHSDPHIDVSSSMRFHPLEAAFVLLWQAAFLTLAGLPLWVMFLRLGVATLISYWQHANIAIPDNVDRRLRAVVVTPNMHRLHHSPVQSETDSNYGVIFSFWDRLFRTYRRPHPEAPTGFGLNGLMHSDWQTVIGMLMTPLRAGRVSIF